MKKCILFVMLISSSLSVYSQATVEPDYILLGRDSLPVNGQAVNDTLFFFDAGKGALRGGILNNSSVWAPNQIGGSSFAYGHNVRASGERGAIALGYQTIASGIFGGATALGYQTEASGDIGATALGINTVASGDVGATSLGYNSEASGYEGATSLGSTTVASGSFGATAIGYYTEASGHNGTTALGYLTKATGNNGSTALGLSTKAMGDNGATALGYLTEALGNHGATALGYLTEVSGDRGATALGYRTTASGNSCTVVGTNNDTIVTRKTPISSTSPLFIVGNGDSGVGNESNAMVVRKDGYIGIGINQPEAKLHLKSDSLGKAKGVKLSNSNQNSLFYHDANGNLIIQKLIFDNQLVLGGNNNIGIKRVPVTNSLEVEGNASKTTAGSWAANSDARLKKNIVTIPEKEAMKMLLQMRGVSYEWQDDVTGYQRPSGTQIGLIAQEVMDVFPEKVEKDGLGYYQTAYGDYDPLFIQAFKALYKELQESKNENKVMHARYDHEIKMMQVQIKVLTQIMNNSDAQAVAQ